MADRNLYHLLIRRGLDSPTKAVLETEAGERWSAPDLDRESARIAHFLTGLGLAPGDRVAVQIDKSVQSLLLYLACLRSGLVYLPLNTAYQPAEVGYFLGDAEPRAIVCRPGSLDDTRQLARACGALHVYTVDADGSGSLFQACASAPADFATVPRDDADLAVIVYTSGTTGRSKGAMLSHGNLASNALALQDYWGFRPDDVLLHTLPMFHVHGLFVANHLGLMSGSTMLFQPRFDVANVLRDLRRATVFMGVPTYYTRLLAEPAFGRDNCPRMRLFVSGSAPLLAETFRDFAQRTGHTILERYGMTETGMNTSNPLNGERRAGSVGLPLPGVEARVVDDGDSALPPGAIGHIQVRGPNVFSGYWRRPDKNVEEFTADRFFRTGDMGEFSADGYLSIVGRAKDLIISGGYNVYPKEIELCIDDIPGVLESAVFGVPHPDFGEAVTAAVVLKPGTAEVPESELIGRLKTQLANYKIPKRVYFVPELPRNTMGKVQKNVLRDRWSGDAGTSS